ncbi:MAG: hypothetical protein ACOX0U_00795 [Oscillospiraceae bacterium]|jgi:hypothetical protein
MDHKTRRFLVVLVAILCVCPLAACSRQAVRPTPTPTGSGSLLPTTDGSHQPPTPPATNEQINSDDIDIGGLGDSELIDYLLAEVPEVYQMVTEGGMSALVTGETTELEDICRDIWLGTNLDGKFTREILYTISPSGAIYMYHPLEDTWKICNATDGQAQLAYVKLDKVLADGLVQFLVDDVLWIDDVSKPNGYAIDNKAEDWVPYTATLWTECHVWIYVPDVGMERYQVSLDHFVEELRGRQGHMLADIKIDEGSISFISERYTP